MIRNHFARQPGFQAGLDYTHPIARKITGGVAAHYGLNAVDIVSGQQAIVCGSPPLIEDRAGGRATSGSSSRGLRFPTPPSGNNARWGDLTLPCSLEFYFSGNNSGVVTFDRGIDLAGIHAGEAGGGWDIEVNSNLTQPNFITWFSSFAFSQPIAAGSLTRNIPTHVIITTTGNSGGANNWFSWINGVFEAGWFTNTTSAGVFNLHVNCFDDTGSNSGDWPFYFFNAYHGTVLSPFEIAQRAARPWDIYRSGGRIVGLATTTPVPTGVPPFFWQMQT